MIMHDPKLHNMAQTLPLSVFIAFKGTNVYIFILYMIQIYFHETASLTSL